MEKATAQAWRRIGSSYNLIGSECRKCGTLYFPPRIVCRKCGRGSDMHARQFKGTGTLFSFTKIHVPAEAFRGEAPYTVGIVELDEGPRVEGHIVSNGREAKLGSRVKTAFRRLYAEGEEGIIHYHFKFELV